MANEVGTAQVARHPIINYTSYLRIFIGLSLVILLFVGAFHSLISSHRIFIGVYLLIIAFPILLLELGLIIRTLCGTNGALCNLFGCILHLDGWSRGLLYAILSIPTFISAITDTLAFISGIFLCITSFLYFVKTFGYKTVKTVPAPTA